MSSLNRLVRALARLTYFRRGFYARFLVAGVERHERLFGKYRFEMDLRLGRLQKIFYLKPGSYEPQTERFIRQNVKPGMTVLDIGANTGYMTILLADMVGAHGRSSCTILPSRTATVRRPCTSTLATMGATPLAT